MSAAIIAIGEPMLEFNQVRDADGETRYLPGFGGDTSNFAVAAARQGASVAYFTRLGADAFGDAFVDLWREEGIDTSLIVRDADSPTGIVFVTHSQAGHAFIYYRKDSAASRMVADDVPAEAVAGARVLHVSAISQANSAGACDAVFAAMEAARANGGRVSYDTNLRLKLWDLTRARAVIHETVAMSDICLP